VLVCFDPCVLFAAGVCVCAQGRCMFSWRLGSRLSATQKSSGSEITKASNILVGIMYQMMATKIGLFAMHQPAVSLPPHSQE